jgi:hypothetical protein
MVFSLTVVLFLCFASVSTIPMAVIKNVSFNPSTDLAQLTTLVSVLSQSACACQCYSNPICVTGTFLESIKLAFFSLHTLNKDNCDRWPTTLQVFLVSQAEWISPVSQLKISSDRAQMHPRLVTNLSVSVVRNPWISNHYWRKRFFIEFSCWLNDRTAFSTNQRALFFNVLQSVMSWMTRQLAPWMFVENELNLLHVSWKS